MKKNLVKLQEEMKARLLAQSVQQTRPSNNSPALHPVVNNTPVLHHSVSQVVNKPLCSHCKRRVCRKGSALCSRCTGTGIQTELRDALPGMEVQKHEVIKFPVVEVTSVEVNGQQIPNENLEFDNISQQDATVDYIASLDPTGKYYTRRQVAQILGVSTTSICRWEQKGKTPQPMKVVRTGQLFYSEEHLEKLKEFMNTVVIVQHQPRPETPENQQHDAAKFVAKKTFKLNRGIEKAVSLQLGRGGLGSGKLL